MCTTCTTCKLPHCLFLDEYAHYKMSYEFSLFIFFFPRRTKPISILYMGRCSYRRLKRLTNELRWLEKIYGQIYHTHSLSLSTYSHFMRVMCERFTFISISFNYFLSYLKLFDSIFSILNNNAPSFDSIPLDLSLF